MRGAVCCSVNIAVALRTKGGAAGDLDFMVAMGTEGALSSVPAVTLHIYYLCARDM